MSLAPLGGYGARDIRLVCRRLAHAGAPVVFSSIEISGGPEEYDELVVELVTNSLGFRDLVKSIYFVVAVDTLALPVAVLSSLKTIRRLRLTSADG